ncbi:MAG: DUF5131 family protein, partial [Anaerolineae bacterium]|nr:DUF5131 family protein [Anaerolineae bacterium]
TFLRDVFAVMALCPEHTFQVLTKRAHVLPLWLTEDFADGVEWSANVHAHFRGARYHQPEFRWPLPNVWLGVTAEDQKRADSRIPDLLRTKAAVRFVSLEPLLQPVYLHQVALAHGFVINSLEQNTVGRCGRIEKWKPLDWIIIGAESGPNRRPMELEWAIDLVRQCQAAGVACFVKQIPVNGKVSKDLNEWPEELRVREYPR